jgi:ABC-type sugar transport system substrate-binding protein
MTRTFTLRRILIAASCVGLLAVAACGSNAAGGQTAAGGVKPARMGMSYPFGPGGTLEDFVGGLKCYASHYGLPDPPVAFANGDVNQQLSDIDTLVTQGVDSIYVLPLDPTPLAPAYKRAQDGGVPIIDVRPPGPDGKYDNNALGHVSPNDAGVIPQVVDQVLKGAPAAKRALILGPPPSEPLGYARVTGIEKLLVDKGIDVPKPLADSSVTSEASQRIVEDALTQYPDTGAVIATNGVMAQGAALAVKSQHSNAYVISVDSGADVLNMVKSGQINAAFGVDLFTLALKASEEGARLKSGEKATPTLLDYKLYTKDNADVPSLDERCKAYFAGKG